MITILLIKYPESQLDVLGHDAELPPDAQLGLTERGKALAETLGENLAEVLRGRVCVWSGPALRCREVADIIAEKVGGEQEVNSRLDERNVVPSDASISVGEFRAAQERGYLEPSRVAEDEVESPLSHRLRVEAWLAEILGRAKGNECHVVVGHGAVVEHLHSSLNWKPAGAMASSFTFCAPGHAHVWSGIELPDERRIWCCLGANLDLTEAASCASTFRGLDDVDRLAVDLAADPRFQRLAEATSAVSRDMVYYIR